MMRQKDIRTQDFRVVKSRIGLCVMGNCLNELERKMIVSLKVDVKLCIYEYCDILLSYKK